MPWLEDGMDDTQECTQSRSHNTDIYKKENHCCATSLREEEEGYIAVRVVPNSPLFVGGLPSFHRRLWLDSATCPATSASSTSRATGQARDDAIEDGDNAGCWS